MVTDRIVIANNESQSVELAEQSARSVYLTLEEKR